MDSTTFDQPSTSTSKIHIVSAGAQAGNKGARQVSQNINWPHNPRARSSPLSEGESTTDYFNFSPQVPITHPFDFMYNAERSLPQAFEELYLERSYLLDSLQQQSNESAKLLRNIFSLEGKLLQEELHHVHRKLRRRLGWLKHKSKEASQQERAILARLEQVMFEIQSRERWIQIEQERQQQNFHQREQFLNYQQGLWHEVQHIQRFQLDLARPEFYPQGYFPPYDQAPRMHRPQWQQEQHDHVNRCHASETSFEYASELPVKPFTSGQVSPRSITRSDSLAGSNNPPRADLSRRSASLDSAELKLLLMDTLLVQKPVMYRHSFPILPEHTDTGQPPKKEQAEADASDKSTVEEKLGTRTSM